MGFLRLQHCRPLRFPLHIVQQFEIHQLTYLYFSKQKIGTIGITEYAQKALGDVVFVELPTAGTEVAKHGKLLLPILSLPTRLTSTCACITDQIGAVESVKGRFADSSCRLLGSCAFYTDGCSNSCLRHLRSSLRCYRGNQRRAR